MPNTKSAKKHLKTDLRRRLQNRVRKSRIKTTEKHLMEKVTAQDASGAREALSQCFSELDKAAKAGTIHRRKADRQKGRLAARAADVTAAATND